MAIALLAIDYVIGNDREKDVVSGEVAYCGHTWFTGLYQNHSYEGHFKGLRDDSMLLENRVDPEKLKIEGRREIYHTRIPDSTIVTVPTGIKIRTQGAMSHWWTERGWDARALLVKEAYRVLEEKGHIGCSRKRGHDMSFLKRRVLVPELRLVK